MAPGTGTPVSQGSNLILAKIQTLHKIIQLNLSTVLSQKVAVPPFLSLWIHYQQRCTKMCHAPSLQETFSSETNVV